MEQLCMEPGSWNRLFWSLCRLLGLCRNPAPSHRNSRLTTTDARWECDSPTICVMDRAPIANAWSSVHSNSVPRPYANELCRLLPSKKGKIFYNRVNALWIPFCLLFPLSFFSGPVFTSHIKYWPKVYGSLTAYLFLFSRTKRARTSF
jgi:hypothetical protein